MGRPRVYDYSPSVIQTGNVQQFWWCGQGNNPNKPSQISDTIQYATRNTVTNKVSFPLTVLGETPGGWDSAYTCNPKVVEGIFNNPLGNGQTYTYAMYYVGTAEITGVINNIGVAFSNDGIHWKKYPKPVILATTQVNYGVAQPVPYNTDHKSAIRLFYEDVNGPQPNLNVETISTDGIHFTVVGTLTTNGIENEDGWGDIAYDSAQGYWYGVFNDVTGRVSSADGITDSGGAGVTLYRIQDSSLLNGATPWQKLKTIDTNLLGNQDVFIAGLLRDRYGNLNVGPYPAIDIFPAISDPAPRWDADQSDILISTSINQWDIGKAEWVPGASPMALNVYSNSKTQETTTGWIDPNGGFTLKSTLGHLYESPQNGASLAIYACKEGNSGYFMSTDRTCGGSVVIGLEGFGYAQPQAKGALVPLYNCYTNTNNDVSPESQCNSQGSGSLLGYALP
ncbi:MAG TPA: hypothetical protein VHW46_06925 [Terracidiphilus sp.]|jgi:hypothetical protein|nr:hypothetical protein [Terracidiphilus sp.]